MGKELGIYPKCHGTCQIPVNPTTKVIESV